MIQDGKNVVPYLQNLIKKSLNILLDGLAGKADFLYPSCKVAACDRQLAGIPTMF